MSENEYDPSGNSNSLFQVRTEVKFIIAICRFDVAPCATNT